MKSFFPLRRDEHTRHVAGRLEEQLLLLALERHVPAGVPLRLPLGVLLPNTGPVQAAAGGENH